jgi:hypothetical protein
VLVGKTVDGTLAIPNEAHEAAIPKHAELMTYGRRADPCDRRQVTHAEIFARESKEDAQTRGVREGGEDVCHRADVLFARQLIENAGDSRDIYDRGLTCFRCFV